MSISSRSSLFLLTALLLGLCALLAAATADARELYAGNSNSDDVTVIDVNTGQTIGAPIPTGVGSEPFSLTVSPDGRTVYVANYDLKSIATIDTQTKTQVGAPIPVGSGPIGIAVTPDGTRAYTANSDDATVSVIDLITRQTIGAPIHVGGRPENPILTPDAKKLYVPNYGDGYVTVIDTATNQVVKEQIDVGDRTYVASVSPDGRRLFVTSIFEDAVYVIDTATDQVVGSPIPVGDGAAGIALSPDGLRAYVGSYESATVDVVDTASLAQIGAIGGAGEAEFIALTPDGRRGFASNYSDGKVRMFDTQTNQLIGDPISAGEGTGGIAVVPNQPPVAVLNQPLRVRPGVAVALSGAGSLDPDGVIASFGWSFGDGGAATVATPAVSHTFAKPGTYAVALTLADNEGCSTSFITTGTTPFCNGSAVATKTLAVKVANPGVKVRCPKSAGAGGCKVAVQAVARKGKGEKRRLKAQSAGARVKLKAGKSAVVSLKPKKSARKKLARAKKILVRETLTIGGEKQVVVRKLKVVQ
jgi:YVTN family beta-propeller protein